MKKLQLDKNGIYEYQQNREPYLMIDFATEIIPGKSAGYRICDNGFLRHFNDPICLCFKLGFSR